MKLIFFFLCEKEIVFQGNCVSWYPIGNAIRVRKKRKRNWKKRKKKGAAGPTTHICLVESPPTLVGWLPWENN
jgi:hypothetical protein